MITSSTIDVLSVILNIKTEIKHGKCDSKSGEKISL